MNIIAFIVSLIGALITFAGFFFTRKTESKMKSSSIRLVSAIGGFMFIPLVIDAMGMAPGDSAQAGTYFFYILVAGVILSKLFGKKKSADS